MRYINLTQGKKAIVDDEDYERLVTYKWYFINGYAQCCKRDGKRSRLWMHRVILGTPEDKETDHINGNGLDNRKSNLRACTRTENIRNRRINKNNTSGYRGVYWSKNNSEWRAQIVVDYKTIDLGGFSKAKDAAEAYDTAVVKYHGAFARPNKVTK